MKKITILISLFLFCGCSTNLLFLDESDLLKVVNYYYKPGSPTSISANNGYHFLSEKSKAQITIDEWNNLKGFADYYLKKSVSILGKKDFSGCKYAIVSIEAYNNNVKYFKYIYSRTWILEKGKWRYLRFPKLEEEANNSFKAGDYTATKARAEKWLDLDPYSIDAYDLLGFSISRSNTSSSENEKPMDDIIRAMLGINPDDTTVLSDVVNWTDTASIAQSYLKKLEDTDSYQTAAFNFATKIVDFNSRLKFLEGIEITPSLAMLKLDAMGELLNYGSKKYSWNDFNKVAASDGSFENIRADLDNADSKHAAGWAGKLGFWFLMAKDINTARKWLNYGISRDPNNVDVKILADNLDK